MPVYKRNCDYCGNYYEGSGVRFCSPRCYTDSNVGTHKVLSSTRFWAKVTICDLFDCWIWTASKNALGYGHSYYAGTTQLAHRVAYQIARGFIPDGLCVLHKCDNPSCVNPSHLFLGTNQDNVADMVTKGRQAHLRGELNGSAKLTEDKVREIRKKRASGMLLRVIAAEFGVSLSLVNQIATRKAWRYTL